MISYLILWIGAGIVLWWYVAHFRKASSGIALAYYIDLSMIHLPGAMIYALPWYVPSSAYLLSQGNSLEVVREGFLQSTIGVLAFVAGVALLSPILLKFLFKKSEQKIYISHPKLPMTYLQMSLGVNFIAFPILKNVPSFSALSKMGWYLIIVSISLLIWQSFLEGRKNRVSGWLQKAGFFLPVLTVFGEGFLGFGIRAFMSIFVFYLTVFRIRRSTLIKLFFMMYLGLSLFVSYMEQREAIRNELWYETNNLSKKIDAVTKIVTEFSFFSIKNNDHLEFIDVRLNQNVLVGHTVNYLREKGHSFAQGQTIMDAFISIIPRILWPNKPMKAGSGNMVSTYTGREFAEGTSIGMGQVFEFYINFGTAGVVIGFLILGALVGSIDQMAVSQLRQGNWQGFAFWFLPGMAMIQAGGSLAEIVMSSAAGFIFILILNKTVLSRYLSKPMKE